MKHIKVTGVRIALILLSFALLLPLASCAKPGESEITTASVQTTAEVAETTEDKPAETLTPDDIPDTLKFNEEVNVLCWGNSGGDFITEAEDVMSAVEDAVYKRNLVVMERLGITFNWNKINGAWAEKDSFTKAVVNDQTAGGSYDMIGGYSLTGAMIAVQGLLQNLEQYDVINTDKPWWPKTLLETNKVCGKLYYISGDISPRMLFNMYGIYVNKTLFADLHPEMAVEDIYKTVDDGKWTVDSFYELTSTLGIDTNADGLKDAGDFYGFVSSDVCMDAFSIASNMRFLVTAEDGTIALSEDTRSDKMLLLLQKIDGYVNESPDNWISQSNAIKVFNNNGAVFINEPMRYATELQTTGIKYGILPIPKYDTEQENYYTCVDFGYTVFSIPIKAKNPDAAATAIECMASEAYRGVTPLVFEVTMMTRYSDAPDDARMFKLIRDNVIFESGRSFAMLYDTKPFGLFRLAIRDKTVGTWTSDIKGIWRALESYNKKVNNQFNQYE